MAPPPGKFRLPRRESSGIVPDSDDERMSSGPPGSQPSPFLNAPSWSPSATRHRQFVAANEEVEEPGSSQQSGGEIRGPAKYHGQYEAGEALGRFHSIDLEQRLEDEAELDRLMQEIEELKIGLDMDENLRMDVGARVDEANIDSVFPEKYRPMAKVFLKLRDQAESAISNVQLANQVKQDADKIQQLQAEIARLQQEGKVAMNMQEQFKSMTKLSDEEKIDKMYEKNAELQLKNSKLEGYLVEARSMLEKYDAKQDVALEEVQRVYDLLQANGIHPYAGEDGEAARIRYRDMIESLR